MKKKKAGRPPIAGKRFTGRLLIECDEKQKSRWMKVAAKSQQTLSAWVRSVLDAAAK